MYRRSPSQLGRFLVLVAGAATVAACAHRPSASESDRGFRTLQRHEAAIARAESERGQRMQRGASACDPPMLDATASVCRESAALCATSRELADRDANARCLRAEDACSAARKHGSACARQTR